MLKKRCYLVRYLYCGILSSLTKSQARPQALLRAPAAPFKDLKYGPPFCRWFWTVLYWVYNDSEAGAYHTREAQNLGNTLRDSGYSGDEAQSTTLWLQVHNK